MSTSSTPLGASSSSSASTSSACRRWTRTARRINPLGVVEGALELAEHAVFGGQVVLGHALGQLLQELALFALEVPGDDHVDDDPQVPVAAAPERRHPPAAEHERLVGLDPRRDLQVSRPIQGRHLHVVPRAASGAATSTTVTRSSCWRTNRGSSRTWICTYRS